MASENRACQNCAKQFVIEADDFAFYERIKVPSPTFCPDCRLERRLAFFNLFSLHRRKCDLCGKEVMSRFAKDAPYTVYCPKCWWSDAWDPFSYGKDFDPSRPFLEQVKELWRAVPLLGLSIDIPTMEHSPYTNHVGYTKNGYLIFHADYAEDSAYAYFMTRSRQMLDTSVASESERCYDSRNIWKDSNCIGVENTIESVGCAFVRNGTNCQNCFGSANSSNKSHEIFNQPYSREEYQAKMKEFDLGSYKGYVEAKRRAAEHWKKYPPKPRWENFSENVTGNYVFNAKNAKECYEVSGVEDSKYLLMTYFGVRDSYDISSWGNNAELCYDSVNVGENASAIRFSSEAGINLDHADYCFQSWGGTHHLGCVAAKKGEYVILNKRYSKEEFEKLRAEIVRHMDAMPYVDAKGRIYKYGEMFPIEFSPYGYNETLAMNFFPLSKEEIEAKGYKYRAIENVSAAPVTKKAAELPDHIKDADESILDEVIGCEECGKSFRVIRMEFELLKHMNLPLPRRCPFCRIGEKVGIWVKQLKLTDRECMKCRAAFRTPYGKEEFSEMLCPACYKEEYA